MYAAAPYRGAGRAVVPRAPAASPRARLRAALFRQWRQAQRAAVLNVPVGTVKRGRA
ncbi:hypothetical protein [Streptomyces noursei]|uniref:hypothetical protein n=1 Tax=Streptomyces noursei TaxID=1971 RepID=UPI001674649A|nr:hypothetical protein [Streptomyces noursei]MCZ1017611.1 hypothetical protein [Streptomyces noursei]GGX15582.1 hypothetical protein GCM10010341_41370 [Streptomyces noursei]